MKNETWRWRPIGDLFEIGAGKTMSRAAREGDHKTPFLRTSNVLWDRIDLTTVDEMTLSPDDLASKCVKSGDLLVCEGGEIGRAAIWDGQVATMAFQNHLHRLRPLRNDVVPRFYVYFLQCAFTQLGIFEGAGNKTTIPNLSRNRLADLEVPHPDPDEASAIVAVLAAIRGAVAAHERAVALAEELKTATMAEVFTRGVRGEERKETEFGSVPASWEVAPLSTHFDVCSGGTPSRADQAYWVGGTIPWVKTTEVAYKVIVATEEHITPLGLAESAAKLLPAGTLLLAMYGQGVTRGKVGLLGIEAACNQACAAVISSDERIRSKYLYHFLTYRYDAIRQLAHGGQQQNLNLDIVRNFDVAAPVELEEQDEIVAILDAIDQKIDLHRRKRALLDELFKSLLHKLMTGEVRVTDLDLSALPTPSEASP